MELAIIPLIALAGSYVISNTNQNEAKSKSKINSHLKPFPTKQESFQSMGTRSSSLLPNTDIPFENYPVTNYNQLDDNVQQYLNPNAATDKYFNQTYFEKEDLNSLGRKQMKPIYSLSGNYMDSNEFKHNNMVPFFGGKIKGQVYDMAANETRLDNMVGTGSQSIEKKEQAPLFKPEDNVQWAYGAPNMSDFYQSRVNPSMNNAMVKPFETQRVGPGMNQGYGTAGSGGFNSGMESRDSWLPKTVDELRIATNPKMEYTLENHEGPAYSHVQNRGMIGKVEKYRPDTFFVNSQDRWLTTTGQEKAPTYQPIQMDRFTNRKTTTQEYTGVASAAEKNGTYTIGSHTAPKRNILGPTDVPSSYAGGHGPQQNDTFLDSFSNYSNNRSTSRQPDTFRSAFNSAIGAVVAPIMDILRPTKKDEYGDNIRIYGDGGSKIPQSYVLNPGDRPATTIKQTTLYSPDTYIGNLSSQGHVLQNHQPIANQRDTTSTSYTGLGGNNQYGMYNTDAASRQHNNDRLEAAQPSYTPQGNTQIFNQMMNVNIAKREGDIENTRDWMPGPTNSRSQLPPGIEMYGKTSMRPQYNDNRIGLDRIQPDLLQAFKNNPYTHSLTNCV